ncbi:Sorting nexin-14 [Nymphon striatum]|nr:Sorting nexin-14 [Nymphon striatum]
MLGIVVLACFVAGILVSMLLVRPGALSIDFLFMLKNPEIQKEDKISQCLVCGDPKCDRHVPEEYMKKDKPWENMLIPKEVDTALEEFLNLALEEYVNSWYNEISQDASFLRELHELIRYALSSLYSRCNKVNILRVITDKLLKAGLSHLDSYLQVKKDLNDSKQLEAAFFQYYANNIHVAARNRKYELRYLRKLCEQVMKHLLSEKTLECNSLYTFLRELLAESIFLPSMDIIANPMIIYPDAEEKVSFLQSFSQVDSSKLHFSALSTNLQLILYDNQLFYSFMTFLKREGAVNTLQFCMSVEDFNKKILGPDWKIQNLEELKSEMKIIYQTYCSKTAPDRIKFHDDILKEIFHILEGPTEDMFKFHSSDVMLRAYDQAYEILETVWCRAYHQSTMYYALICGNRTQGQINKTVSKGTKKESSTVSKISSKLRDVFKASTIDGQVDLDKWKFVDEAPVLAEAVFAEDDLNCTLTSDIVESTNEIRDLSAWRVSVSNVESRMDVHNKQYYVYIIEVQRIDIGNLDDKEEPNWTVERKYHEFYVFEMKLIEFHGELHDIHLPPKRGFATKKTMEFMQRNITPFEMFLQKLLVQPSLKGSQLLYNFLTANGEFTVSFFPEIGLGKIFKTVPMKLRKEKGQNLESFLNFFMLSTEQVKPIQSKLDWKDVFEESTTSSGQKLINSLYEDNAGVDLKFDANVSKSKSIFKLHGICDYILYLCGKVFCCPAWFMSVLMAVKIIGKTTIDTFYYWYMENKLKNALKPQNIVKLIETLSDTIFRDNESLRSEQQKSERLQQVYKEAHNFLPSILKKLIRNSNVGDGMNTIITALQYPKLNKQLSYMLLDIIISEIFPELIYLGGRDSSHL